MVQAVEFPLILIAVPFTFSAVVLSRLGNEVELTLIARTALSVVFLSLLFAAFVPSALLAEGLIVRRSVRLRSRKARIVPVAVATLFFAALVLVATQTALTLGFNLSYQPTASDRASMRGVEVLGLRCGAHRDRLTAEFFLWNPSTVAVVVVRQELSVHFGGSPESIFEEKGAAIPDSENGSDQGANGERTVPLAPGAIQRFSVNIPGSLSYQQSWGNCEVLRWQTASVAGTTTAPVYIAENEWTPEERGEPPTPPAIYPPSPIVKPPINYPSAPSR